MERWSLVGEVVAAASDVARGAGLALVTVLILVVGSGTLGFVILFRRRGDAGVRDSGPSGIASLSTRAGVLLVRLDDALRSSDDELGFAIAQFGPEAARPFADALADARAKATEAFRIKQKLHDAEPDSEQEQRQWTLQVIALCEQAESALAQQETAFGARRTSEVGAGAALEGLRGRIAAASARVDTAKATIKKLTADYEAPTFAAVAQNPAEAAKQLTAATKAADAAAPRISDTGVNDVSAALQECAQAVHRAELLLHAVDAAATSLADADAALGAMLATTEQDLDEARAERDTAPDAETGAAIIAAIDLVTRAVEAARRTTGKANPILALDSLGVAVAQLDSALAGARNQAQRLEHARAALTGTLVSAKSQIAAVHAYIGRYGGGADARTRLSEAERQLMLAEAAHDPVEALDTARRAVTHARDADALARYDTMGSR